MVISAIRSLRYRKQSYRNTSYEETANNLLRHPLSHELLFLNECMNFHGAEAVLHWAGSEDETHDFYFGPNAVEVKTTSVQAPYFASISSEYQLDNGDVPGKLFLRFYAFRKSHSEGEKLPELIAEIRGKLGENLSMMQKFNEKLKKYGYFDEAEDDLTYRVIMSCMPYAQDTQLVLELLKGGS